MQDATAPAWTSTLVIFGAVVTLIGLGLLIWCILLALRIRRAGGTDEEIRARLQKLVALNLGALGLSGLGLMMVVMGVVLG